MARVGPILLFLAAVTVVAELADLAGVFDVAAREAAAWGRGRVLTLWLLVVALATVTTVVLSLDTTAVLLTPVVLALAAQLGLSPLPFALTTIWLANTASLLLPVSNLTNLLAVDRLDWTTRTYVGAIWPAALASIGVTVVVLLLLHRRALTGRYVVPAPPGLDDIPTFVIAAATCLGAGRPVRPRGALLGGGDGRRFRPRAHLRGPAAAVSSPGRCSRGSSCSPSSACSSWSRRWHSTAAPPSYATLSARAAASSALLQVAGVGAATSNVVNNLPAYLAVEPAVAETPQRLLALLVGTNAGPLITVWGSLATLLWRERCLARGVHVSWRRFALEGLLLVPLVTLASVGALALAG